MIRKHNSFWLSETHRGYKSPVITRAILITAILIATLTACAFAGNSDGTSSSDGEALFRQSVIGSSAGCATCHSTEPGVVVIGPSLAGISSTRAQRVEGQSAEDYLRQSILEPDAHVVEGFPSGVMPARYADDLAPEQVDSLVSYLLTLK